MQGVLYTAVVAASLLGILFILAYFKRDRGVSPGRAAAQDETDGFAESVRRVAEAEAASTRQLAQTEADALRRAAMTEADAVRRAARSDAAAAAAEAESTQRKTQTQIDTLMAQARRDAEAEVARLTEAAARAERDVAAQGLRLDEQQTRLEREAAKLAAETDELDAAVRQVEASRLELEADRHLLASRTVELEERSRRQVEELERVAGLSTDEAKAELMTVVEAGARREAAVLVRSIENEARTEATTRARSIVAEAVQRVASEQTSETVVSVLHLPGDEMKGRIIGREGRNIRAFESVTGVNVIIDDTPEAVLLSCFDPVRREVGRLTLEKLIVDGRIHPHRIEEAYELSRQEVDELCLRAARDALRRRRDRRSGRAAAADARPAEVPHELRAERARPPRRNRAHRRRDGRRTRRRADPGQTLCVPARHRQGAHARGRGQPRDRRRGPAAPVRRDPRRSRTPSRPTTTRCSRAPSRRS